MFRFTVQGRIGSIKEYKNNVVRVSVAAERIVQGRSDTYTATEWAPCVSFGAGRALAIVAPIHKNLILVGRHLSARGIAPHAGKAPGWAGQNEGPKERFVINLSQVLRKPCPK